MTLFLIFLVTSLLVSYGYQTNQLKGGIIFSALIFIFLASHTACIQLPYIIDDIDNLNEVSAAIENHQVWNWLFIPHNEHSVPVINVFIYLFYKFFWLYSQPFHVLVLFICSLIVIFTFLLVKKLTQSAAAGFLSAFILTSSNMIDNSIFISGESYILFCALLYIMTFYLQYKYYETTNPLFLPCIFITVLFLPLTFALGLFSIIFCVLFELLCIPKELKSNKKHCYFPILTGWLISLIPYILHMQEIVFAKHYHDINYQSINQVLSLVTGIKYLFFFFVYFYIPNILPNIYISMAILFSGLFIITNYFKNIAWKKVLFFILLGFGLNLVVFVGRIKWGPGNLMFDRYNVFPLIMFSFLYGIIFSTYLTPQVWAKGQRKFIACFTFFLILSLGSSIRFAVGKELNYKVSLLQQNFNLQYQKIFTDFMKDKDENYILNLEDKLIPTTGSYKSDTGIYPHSFGFSRYPRKMSFFAQYILPVEIKKKIRWSTSATDEEFLNYLRNHEEDFLIFSDISQLLPERTILGGLSK